MMMRFLEGKLFIIALIMFMTLSVSANVCQADFFSINAGCEENISGFNGGIVTDGGVRLPIGCKVQYINAGADLTINPPNADGTPGGDDTLITIEAHTVGDDTVYYYIYNPGTFYHGVTGQYTTAVKVYVRAWNASTIAAATRYGDSILMDPAVNSLAPPTPNDIGIPNFATDKGKPGTSGPTITSLVPPTGEVGTIVVINGTNFGPNPGVVIFQGGGPAPIDTWTDTQIIVRVPVNSIDGNVVVTTSGGSDSAPFDVVAPMISGLTPTSGNPNTTITINGAFFGTDQGGSTVTVGGILVTNYTTWETNRIVCNVPNTITARGPQNVIVTTGGGASSPGIFTVVPYLTSITPNSGPVGTSVTIVGQGLGNSGTLRFNGVVASTTSWNPTQIIATVPVGATTGNVVVTRNGYDSNPLTFTVSGGGSDPAISGIVWETSAVHEGYVNGNIIINGSNFGADLPAVNSIEYSFNGGSWAEVPDQGAGDIVWSWSDTQITAKVPNSIGSVFAEAGNISVRVNVSGKNSATGSVYLKPKVYSINPARGASGDTILINGTAFSPLPFSYDNINKYVRIDGDYATVTNVYTSGNSSTLEVVVPSLLPGTYNVTVGINGQTSNTTYLDSSPTTPVTFEVVGGNPAISSIGWQSSPTHEGFVYGNLVIKGSNFGVDNPAINSIEYQFNNGSWLTVPDQGAGDIVWYWSNNEIQAMVPNNISGAYAYAGTINVRVNVAGKPAVTGSIYLRPKVYGVNPSQGPKGSTIQISGTGFPTTPGGFDGVNNYVRFGSTNATVTNVITGAGSNTLEVVVPNSLTGGVHAVTIGVNGRVSNATYVDWDPTQNVEFEVTGAPAISNITWVPNANAGFIYGNININGNGFGTTRPTVEFSFDGGTNYVTVPTTEIYWYENTKVEVGIMNTVGSTYTKAGTVYARLLLASGIYTNSATFTIRPKVYSVDPVSGPVGTLVRITGTGFDSAAANNTIGFSGTNTTASNITMGANVNTLEVTVPNMTVGPKNVLVTTGGQSSNVNYDYSPYAPVMFTVTSGGGVIPLPVEGISMHRSGNNLVMNWTAATGPVDHYNIYRATTWEVAQITQPSNLIGASGTPTYIDINGLNPGNPSYYYIVRSANASNQESADSNMGYNFRKTLSPNTAPLTSVAKISLPYRNDYRTLDDIAADIGIPSDGFFIGKFDYTTQTHKAISYFTGLGWVGDNGCAINTGEAIEVGVTTPTELRFFGWYDQNFTFNINQNTAPLTSVYDFSVPYNHAYTNLDDLAASITSPVDAFFVGRWDYATQRYKAISYFTGLGWVGDNGEAIQPGEGLQFGVVGSFNGWKPSVKQ